MSLIAASLLMLAAETGQRTIDYWMVYDGRDIDRESIVFVEKSALFQRPDGWINFSFHEVRNGSRLKTFKSRVLGTWVNCKTREYINDYRTEYDRDGAMLQQGKLDEQRRIPAPGTSEAKVLAFACGDTRGATQLAQGAHVVAYADTLYAQGHPPVAKAPATPAAPAARAPASDYWLVYDSADHAYEDIGFVDRSSVERLADGQTLFGFFRVLNGTRQKEVGAKSVDLGAAANCQTREFVITVVQGFDDDGNDLGIGIPEDPPAVVARGSNQEKLLAFACGNAAGAIQLGSIDDRVAFADDIYLSAREATAKAPATPARPAETAPGLGKANWKVISDDEYSMLIYAPATVKRGQDSGQVWFTRIFAKPQNIEGRNGVVTLQFLEAANCKLDSLALTKYSQYGADGRALFTSVIPDPPYTTREDGSPGRTRLDILCGRPVKLPGLPSYDRDVAGMREVYRGLRELSDEISDIVNAP